MAEAPHMTGEETSAPDANSGEAEHFDAHRAARQDEAEAFLLSGAAFPPDAGPVKRIETHAALLALAGDVALKLKKAVRFPFLDQSTLEQRRALCAAEVAINRPFAPDIYRDAVPIRRAGGGLMLGGDEGEIIDWVVRMRRFDEEKTFDRLAATGALSGPLIEAVADAIAASHAAAPAREASVFVDMLARTLDQSLADFAEFPRLFAPSRVARLDSRLRARLTAGRAMMAARGAAGLVRRCHGDLHLRNIALIDGRPTPFDAIEFDEAIATTDVLYDLGFVLMDLWTRGLKPEANRLFNAYLAATQREEDLPGLALLPLYLSIRATIRAKVTAAAAASADGAAARALEAEAVHYFDAAEGFDTPPPARLIAIGGLSGTGKTALARLVAVGIGPAPGALHLRSDIERKAMFRVPPTQPLPPAAYTPDVGARVHARLRHKAEGALAAGHGALVDAVFATGEERAGIERVGIGASVPFRGLFLEAPLGIRLSRVEARVGDASDARAAVAIAQEAYEIGPHRWTVIDASGDLDEMLASARRALGLAM